MQRLWSRRTLHQHLSKYRFFSYMYLLIKFNVCVLSYQLFHRFFTVWGTLGDLGLKYVKYFEGTYLHTDEINSKFIFYIFWLLIRMYIVQPKRWTYLYDCITPSLGQHSCDQSDKLTGFFGPLQQEKQKVMATSNFILRKQEMVDTLLRFPWNFCAMYKHCCSFNLAIGNLWRKHMRLFITWFCVTI